MRKLCVSFCFLSILLLNFIDVYAAEKQLAGVGVQVTPTSGGELVIIRVVDGTPAANAGLLPGDLIDRIGVSALKGMAFEDIIRHHLHGPTGSTIELFYRRPGVAGEQRVMMTRKLLTRPQNDLPGVQSMQLESGGVSE